MTEENRKGMNISLKQALLQDGMLKNKLSQRLERISLQPKQITLKLENHNQDQNTLRIQTS